MNLHHFFPFFLFSCLFAASTRHLVVLKASETIDLFMKYDLSVPTAQRAKDFIGKHFKIGDFHGFVGNFSASVLERLQRCPMVAEITPDISVQAFQVVSQESPPTHLSHLSSKSKLLQTFPWQPYYYDDEESGEDVNVYIVDLGISLKHGEFEGRAHHGKDFTEEGSGDTNGHGTHVAGIVGSKTYGVAKKVRLFEVKTLDSQGQGTLAGILGALEFSVMHRRRARCPGVVNLSLGAVRNSVLNRAVDAAVATGMVVVVAAGNTNEDACRTSPASARGAITVGAMDEATMSMAEFSNYGSCVDIYALGVAVSSVDTESHEARVLTGTSMAAPAVAGMAANFLSGGMPASEVKEQLVMLAVPAMIPSLIRGGRNRVLYNGFDPEESEEDSEEESDEEGRRGRFWRGGRRLWRGGEKAMGEEED